MNKIERMRQFFDEMRAMNEDEFAEFYNKVNNLPVNLYNKTITNEISEEITQIFTGMTKEKELSNFIPNQLEQMAV